MSNDAHDDLGRTYRAAAREVPPDWLDRRILREAHGEVAASRMTAMQSITSRWGLPLALAAVVVLSVSVVLIMREEHAAFDRSDPVSRAGGGRTAVPAPQVGKSAPARDVDASTAPPAATVTPQSRATRATDASVSRESSQAAVAEPRWQEQSPAQQRGQVEKAVVAEDRAVLASPQVPAGAPSEGSERELARGGIAQTPATPATVPRSAPAAADAASNRRDARAEAVSREGSSAPAARAVEATQAAPAAPQPAEGVAASRARSAERPDGVESPERWLDRILLLRRQGRLAEAQASLDEFRKRYPHYPIPDALK